MLRISNRYFRSHNFITITFLIRRKSNQHSHKISFTSILFSHQIPSPSKCIHLISLVILLFLTSLFPHFYSSTPLHFLSSSPYLFPSLPPLSFLSPSSLHFSFLPIPSQHGECPQRILRINVRIVFSLFPRSCRIVQSIQRHVRYDIR